MVDLNSGMKRRGPSRGSGRSSWWHIFLTSRRMHEALLLDPGGLVTASTIAMLTIMSLGIAWAGRGFAIRCEDGTSALPG